jgi:hypothetical protein
MLGPAVEVIRLFSQNLLVASVSRDVALNIEAFLIPELFRDVADRRRGNEEVSRGITQNTAAIIFNYVFLSNTYLFEAEYILFFRAYTMYIPC